MENTVRWVMEWMSLNPILGFGLFQLCASLSGLVLVPFMAWKALAGFAYGLWGGLAAISLSYAVALLLSLWLGRVWLRPWLERKRDRDPRLAAWCEVLEGKGPVFVTLLRLNPFAPFGLVNYALSLSRLQMGPVVFYSWLGSLPSTLVTLWLASHAQDVWAVVQDKPGAWIWVLGVSVCGLTLYLIWGQRKRARSQACP